MIYYKHVVDMAHTYKKAIVKMPDGESKEIVLDDAEKDYLSAVIKPFRKKVMDVVKIQYSGGRQSIMIRVSYGDCFADYRQEHTESRRCGQGLC